MKPSQTLFNIESMNDAVQTKWGWFITLGIALLAMGIFAFGNLLFATTISILYVGALMTVAGVFQIKHSFQVKNWSGLFYFNFSGLLYSTAGVIAFQNPLLAAATLTFFLAIALMASGAMRIWSSFRPRPQVDWGFVLASGIATFLAGTVFIFGWPVNSLWLLGIGYWVLGIGYWVLCSPLISLFKV